MHKPYAASVVIPARDEAATVGAVVEACARQAEIAEVVVVDDGSTDGTAAIAAAAGARVVSASAGPGKGAAMRDGVAAASGELIVFCDADLEDFDGSFVSRLVHALASGDGGAAPPLAMVKGDYERPGGGGRVTELTAKPAIRLLHPHVAHIAQPLGGEYAAWRAVLEPLSFVRGYGVDLGLLLDVAARYGGSAVGQVALGVRRHRRRPLDALALEAEEVLAVALHRAGVTSVRPASCPPLAPAPSVPRPRRSA